MANLHKISLMLDGVVTDTASVELPDGEAFVLFVALKTALIQGSPTKRKARRAVPVDGAGDVHDANSVVESNEG